MMANLADTNTNTRIVHILRGASGAGKSTFADEMRKAADAYVPFRVFSTDQKFMVQLDESIVEDGRSYRCEYQFDPRKLAEYHSQNLREFIEFVSDSHVGIALSLIHI